MVMERPRPLRSLPGVALVVLATLVCGCGSADDEASGSGSASGRGDRHRDQALLANLGFLGARGRAAEKTIKLADPEDIDKYIYSGGVVLAEFDPGSPLTKLGLRPGDVIVRVAGDALPVKEDPSIDLLARIETAYSAGKTQIPLEALRDGETHSYMLRIDPTTLPPLTPGDLERSPRAARAAGLAIARLIAIQREDGSFETAGDDPDARLATTAVAGLALLGGASLESDNVQGAANEESKARIQTLDRCRDYISAMIERDETSHLGAAFATFFLAELIHARSEIALMPALARAFARVLSGQDEQGGWPLGSGETSLGYSERTLATQFALLALATAERSGVQMDNTPFEHAFQAIRDATNDGHAGFVPEPGFDRRTEAARLAGLYAALRCAGCEPLDPMMQAFFSYASQHAKEIPHSPVDETVALLGWALCCRQQGLIQWSLFTIDHMVEILSLQRLDGSFCRLPKAGREPLPFFADCQGEAWRTAIYTVILLLQEDTFPLLTARASAGPEPLRSGTGERQGKPAPSAGPTAPSGAKMIQISNIEDAVEMLKNMGFDEDSPEIKQIKELQGKIGKKKKD